MKLLIGIFALLCVAQAKDNFFLDPISLLSVVPDTPDLPDIDEETLICILNGLKHIEVDEELLPKLTEIIKDFEELYKKYNFCQDIIKHDPPTKFELAAKKACITAWQASVAIEILKIKVFIDSATGDARDLYIQISHIYNECYEIQSYYRR